MILLRKSSDRGYANRGWLESFHSFSFADYYDPQFMGWGNLRVINEDRIAAGSGFGSHGHRNMEIVSYVLSGELAHQDSMGNIKSIPPGDVQRMSAGSGVVHSEFNHAQGQQTHLLQIWIEPLLKGIAPGYEQKTIPESEKRGRLLLVASPDAADRAGCAVQINADARIYAGLFNAGESAELTLPQERKAYVHLIRGAAKVNGHELSAGDALMLQNESTIKIAEAIDSELLVFDLMA